MQKGHDKTADFFDKLSGAIRGIKERVEQLIAIIATSSQPSSFSIEALSSKDDKKTQNAPASTTCCNSGILT